MISEPLIGHTSHKWSIVFARRLERADGSFDGIVYGAMILERYLRLFSGVDIGRQGVVALRDGKLDLIVRQPPDIAPDSAAGRVTAPRPMRDLVAQGIRSGHYEINSPVDGVRRIVFFRQIGDYPLYVVVGVGTDETFALWWRDLYRLCAVAVLFALTSFLVARLLLRSWCRQTEIGERALEANRQLQESLATLRDRDEDLKATQEVGRLGVFSQDFQRNAFVGTGDLNKLFGLAPGELLTVERWLQIVHPEDRARMGRLVARGAGDYRTQLTEEYRIIRPSDGKLAWLQVIAKVERDARGDALRVRGAVQDITERRLAELDVQRLNEELENRVRQRTAQLEAVNQDLIRARDAADAAARAKADFLANMSHEIRTPMNAVIGFTHLAMATDLTARQRDYIGKIMTARGSLLRIINDILDFSKIDAGKLSLENVPFQLERRRHCSNVRHPGGGGGKASRDASQAKPRRCPWC